MAQRRLKTYLTAYPRIGENRLLLRGTHRHHRQGGRDTEYGHKVFLSGGRSTMILGCLIERGNPADADRYRPFLGQHREWYGKMPRQVSADGGFASAPRSNHEYRRADRLAGFEVAVRLQPLVGAGGG